MMRGQSDLLARYAEAAFWMARYVERAENLARLVDVNETFARDSRGSSSWAALVQLNADTERFADRHGEDQTSAENVLNFYLLDTENPTSIRSSIRMARESARTLRPLISTEMWTHLNVFYNRMLALTPANISSPRVSRLCTTIKEACQAHTGIVEGTFYRDEGWYFYQIGRRLERADQTSRLLDIKYHTLLPTPDDVGSSLDISQWNALLRSVAGYHAFRRVHPRDLSANDAAGFLIFDNAFPRSIQGGINEIATFLGELRSRYGLRGGAGAMERLDEIQAVLSTRTIERIVEGGLHEFLDAIQTQLIALSSDLGSAFFGHDYASEPELAEARD
ncbi:MAG: alpha-E domain-containing protein [Pseudomonadota bacterium]